MKSFLIGAAVALALISMTEPALAYGKVGSKTVNSCELTVPFKLRDSERQELERKGYSFRVKRSEFKRERVVQKYEYYELKNKKKVSGNLHLKAIMKSFNLESLKHIANREFQLVLVTGDFSDTLAVAASVPAKWARTEAEEKSADLSNFPACLN